MAAKGKWAQGIQPRHFHWVIKDQLAICERPGGFGSNHRKVRRQEEIIWIREQAFDLVVSVSAAPNNLHSYDELGVKWRHWPLASGEDLPRYLQQSYTELRRLLTDRKRLIFHQDELSDRLIGFLAGYLVWTSMVAEPPKAIALTEHIAGRQIGADGRQIVGEAARLREQAELSRQEAATGQAAAADSAELPEQA
ncbi:MAG TPA: hypothetical protein VL068_09285 [Microthrixaceae bacterium]|nr:hypothetical protein [Microthrixaceae bacterium]